MGCKKQTIIMKLILLKNIRNFIVMVVTISFIVYNIINFNTTFGLNFLNYINWLYHFLIGDLGSTSTGQNISFFNINNYPNTISIGPKYFTTIGMTIFSILFSFSLSLFLNFFIIVKKNMFFKFIRNFLDWLSTIHIIIISILIYSVYQNDITFFIGVFIISISSNAFYELSSLQFSDISILNSKDFIIAARAWGDNVSKHMKRSFLINSINQIFSLWIVFFSNCMIYEMVFQKSGIGYLLWKYYLDSSSSMSSSIENYSIVAEPNILLAIIMLVVLTLSMINMFRMSLLTYLIDIKR